MTEMRGFLIGQMRRRMGLAAVQAFARHRLARVPWIGVPREAVQTRQQRVQMQRRGQGGRGDDQWDPRDFFAYGQAGGGGGRVAAGA